MGNQLKGTSAPNGIEETGGDVRAIVFSLKNGK